MALAARTTQIPVHVVVSSAPPARVTQIPIHVAYNQFQPARVTQIPIHVVWGFVPRVPQSLTPVSPVNEVWQWNTVLTKSVAGFEQRMQLRDNPVVSLEQTFAIKDETDRRIFLTTLHKYIGVWDNLPMYQYSTRLTGTSNSGVSTIAFDPEKTDIRGGEKIAIFDSALTFYELYTVNAVTANGCTLTEPLASTVTTDNFVAPAPRTRVLDNQSMSMVRFHGRGTMTSTLDTDRAVKRPNQNITLTTIDGLPLVDENFVVNNGVSEGMLYNVTTIEAPSIDPIDFRIYNYPQWLTNRRYQVEGRNIDYWRELGDQLKGSLKPFWLPTFRNDIVLSETPNPGDSVIKSNQNGLIEQLTYQTNRRILITTPTGNFYRFIEDVRELQDRTVELELDSALGSNPGDATIERISFVQKVRIADDRITLTHTRTNTEIALAVSSVLDY